MASSVDVHHRAAGEVDDSELEDPATCCPDPVSHREVDESCPERGEDHPRGELGSVCDRAGDEADGDAGEHGLEGHEGHGGQCRVRRVGHEAGEPGILGNAAQKAGVTDIGAEGDGVAEGHPQNAHDE